MEKCSVTNACLLMGALALFGSLTQIIKDGEELADNADIDQQQKEVEVDVLYTDMKKILDIEKDEVRNFLKLKFYIAFADIILCMGMVGATYCLSHGYKNKEEKLLLPLICFLPLDLLVRCFFVFVLVIKFGFLYPLSFNFTALFLFVIIYDVFFWLSAFSHRKQLVASRDESHRYSATKV